MFTGIIECLSEVIEIREEGSNKVFLFKSAISNELKVDQSVAHNGVCLTVTKCGNEHHEVVAIDETLRKSNLGSLNPGDLVNIERCMQMNGRLDGHIVQGHVDTTAICIDLIEEDGSWIYRFKYPDSIDEVTVEKGSITINGVSLTVVNSDEREFSVAIIPYTHEHTNFNRIEVGSRVNLEFDIIGKYVRKMMNK